MKSSESFKKTITAHLELTAVKDPLFAITYKKENKNINDCVTYILNTVKASGESAFLPSEIFKMAIHYYDEDDIKVGQPVSGVKIIGHEPIVLTEEEIAEARQKAIQKVTDDECEKIRKKNSTSTKKKEIPKPGTQFNLL